MRAFMLVLFSTSLTLTLVNSQALNAAFRKPVAANFTCGTPAEQYYTIQDKDKLSNDRTTLTCDASNPSLAHPPSYLVDGSLATFWQSTAWKTSEQANAHIQIDLQQRFFARSIKFTFGDHQRPGSIKISRSYDSGATFTPYHYLVSNPETVQCQRVFGVTHYSKGVSIDRVDRVLCQHYDKTFPLDYNETVEVDLGRRSQGVQNGEFTSEVLAWLNVTNLRLTFLNMHIPFDFLSYKFNHYTAREIEFFARCDCQGHGNGDNCPQDEVTKRRSCVCANNTCGENCEMCCPLYNQKPWSAGSKAPWEIDTSFACEECNCHNHSTSCVYNQTVNDMKLSLDIYGNKSGGGVCQDCQNHTRGINCEKCKEFYYRPKGRDHKREDACQACACNPNGTANVSNVAFLDCVSDDTELAEHPGKEPGDCYCKRNVLGSKCDQCAEFHYNLSRDDPNGCQECKCHLPGTTNKNKTCDLMSGQCQCKANVELRDCSQCKFGYYDLQDSSSDGCKLCDCDVGGTYPKNTCNKTSGQCQCRSNVIGRTCNKLAPGHFYPDIHYIKGERDVYVPASNNVTISISIPKTAKYRLYIGQLPAGTSLVDTRKIHVVNWTSTSGTADPTGCTVLDQYCHIEAGNYSVHIVIESGLKFNYLAVIPEMYLEDTIIGKDQQRQYIFHCRVYDNNIVRANKDICYASTFSNTVAFFNGSIPCGCHPVGSTNLTLCEDFGGQCRCKPGVEGRDCGRCRPGYFNMTSEGCQPCNCKGVDEVCNPITGYCNCPSNTVGRTCEPCQCNNHSATCLRTGECLSCVHNTTGFGCDQCVNMTYGDPKTEHCQDCKCNSFGSLNQYCDRRTGQCQCKPLITGRACTICQNNTYGLSSSGCTDCACNVHGSMSLQCNETGHCQCETGAIGQKCSNCEKGYFGLPRKPCEACNCNSTGTVNGTVCASDAIGQCVCKPGVTGRACDRCEKYYTNFTDQGCTACPACVLKLGQNVAAIVQRVNTTNEQRSLLSSLSQLHSPLTDIERMNAQMPGKSSAFYTRLTTARATYQSLNNVEFPHVNSSYFTVLTENGNLMSVAPAVAFNLSSHVNRTKDIHKKTVTAEESAKDIHSVLQEMLRMFSAQVNFGVERLKLANESVTRHIGMDFTANNDTADMKMKDSNNLTAFVEMLARKLLEQTNRSTDLNQLVENSRRSLTQLIMRWSTTHVQFINQIQNMRDKFGDIDEVVKQTQMVLGTEMKHLNDVKPVHHHSAQILNSTKNTIQSAMTLVEMSKTMIAEVSGDVRISMLKFDNQGNQFSVKVLSARNLSPRDLNGKADPYVTILLMPGNFTLKTTTHISATLNPIWNEFEQLFRFNIEHDQLKKSRLRIQVFDHDADKKDDFMGEVYVDLSEVGDAAVTNWYSLKPEDVSQLESGDFKPRSGLVDVTNLLKNLIDKIMGMLKTLIEKLVTAHEKAQLMKTQSEAIEQEFSRVKDRGASAVQAIQRYIEIERLINNSMTSATTAQSTIMLIASQLTRLPASTLITMAKQEQAKSTTVYDNAIKRNLSQNGVAHVEDYLTQLNMSLQDIVPQWYQAYSHYPALIEAANRLKEGAKDAAPAFQSIKQAEEKATANEQAVTRTVNQVSIVEGQVKSMMDKINYIKTAPQREASLIQKTYLYVNNASMKINQSASAVNNASFYNVTITKEGENISTNLNNIEMKLNALKKRLSMLKLGMAVKGECVASYGLPRTTIGTHKQNDVTLTIRTNASDGDLMKMAGSVVNSQQTGITALLQDGYVQVKFSVGKGDITLVNPIRINDNQWSNIHFTRQGTMGALTVENPTQSRTVMHTSNDYNSTIEFGHNAVVTIGQSGKNAPKPIIFSSLKIDQSTVYFWDYRSLSTACDLALARYPNFYLPDSGQAATFGSAHAWSKPITTHPTYIKMELYFRTFKSEGVVVSSYHRDGMELLIYLKSGRVHAEVWNGTEAHDVVQTKSSNFNNGNWVWLSYELTEKDVTLNVTYNNVVDDNTASTAILSNGHKLKATRLTIGSIAENISHVNVPMKQPFVGDIKDVKLSVPDSKPLVDLSLKQELHVKGVYTNDVIAGMVEPGAARFYGYTSETNACSYVKVNNTEPTASSISFTFKTLKKSALLMYSQATVGSKTMFLYIALWHGSLQILHHDSSNGEGTAYLSQNINFADNVWRQVLINSSAQGFSLYVNKSLIHTGWFGNSRENTFRLNNPVYIGGVEPNIDIPLKSAVKLCFQGAMKNVKFDETYIDLFAYDSVNVVNGGVTPSKPPPPPPPTCAAPSEPLKYSTENGLIGFVSGQSHSQSYLQISDGIDFSLVFIWTLQFRPLSSNGLVFYIADNLTHPERFVSLELIDGKLKYQINLNPGLIDMKTVFDYVNTRTNDDFLKVSGLHIASMHFGAMLVENTKEYNRDKVTSGVSDIPLNLTGPLFIGGVPQGVKLHPLVSQRNGFSGCFKDYRYSSSSWTRVLNLSSPTAKRNVQGCATNALPGFGLNGTSWIKFANLSMNTRTLDIQLEFRTSSRQGIILHLTNNNTVGPGKEGYLELEQINGQLVLKYMNASGSVRSVTWSAASSYLLCNMTWHTVKLKGGNSMIYLTVDQHPSIGLSIGMDANIMGDLFVGGMPGAISTPPKGFTGCIKNLKYAGSVLDYGKASDVHDTTNGCASVNSAQQEQQSSDAFA